MASLLVPRAATLLTGSRGAKASLSASAGTGNAQITLKRSGRSLISKFHPSSSSQITARLLSNTLSVRHYSGRDARRAQRTQTQTPVREYDPENYQRDVVPTQSHYPTQQTPTQQYEQPEQPQQAYSGFNADRTSEELITPRVLGHLRKVYALLGVAAGAATLGGIGSVVLGVGSGIAMFASIGAIVPLIATIMLNPAKVMLRQNLFLGAAALMGVGLGPILSAVALPTILLALGGTGAIMAGFSLAALKAPSASYLKATGVMTGLIFALLGAMILGLLGPMIGIPASILAGLKSFSLYGGLAIFSAFIAYDTQQMIDRAASGDTDHVSDALNLFIDVWGVFVRLLYIFSDD